MIPVFGKIRRIFALPLLSKFNLKKHAIKTGSQQNIANCLFIAQNNY
jgi:hypothetical protein